MHQALTSGYPVLPVFVFDRDILDTLEDRDDGRITFIHQVITELQPDLIKWGSTLVVCYGKPIEIWKTLIEKYPIAAVYANHDYEPYATGRDNDLHELLQFKGIAFHTFKDQVIFEKKEIVNGQGKPYRIFTPYSKKWLAAFQEMQLPYFPSKDHLSNLLRIPTVSIPSLADMDTFENFG